MPQEYLLNAVRSAGQEQRAALHDAADILRMECVDVLQRKDRVETRVVSIRLGQRQLHEDSVHAGIAVELIDQGQELVGRRLGREPVQAAGQPVLLAGLLLVADVDLAGRIFADQDRRQAWLHACPASEPQTSAEISARIFSARDLPSRRIAVML